MLSCGGARAAGRARPTDFRRKCTDPRFSGLYYPTSRQTELGRERQFSLQTPHKHESQHKDNLLSSWSHSLFGIYGDGSNSRSDRYSTDFGTEFESSTFKAGPTPDFVDLMDHQWVNELGSHETTFRDRASGLEGTWNVLGSDQGLIDQSRAQELYDRQVEWEEAVMQEALESRLKEVESVVGVGHASSLRPAQRLLRQWYPKMLAALQKEFTMIEEGVSGVDRRAYGPYLCRLDPPELAVLTMHEVLNWTLLDHYSGQRLAVSAYRLGEAVQREVIHRGLAKRCPEWGWVLTGQERASPSANEEDAADVETANRVSRKSILARQQRITKAEWDPHVRVKVGMVLLKLLMESATIPNPDWVASTGGTAAAATATAATAATEAEAATTAEEATPEVAGTVAGGERGDGSVEGQANGAPAPHIPAFVHEYVVMRDTPTGVKGKGEMRRGYRSYRKVGVIKSHPSLLTTLVGGDGPLDPKLLPMLCPPRPWTNPGDGGYLTRPSYLLRKTNSKEHRRSLEAATRLGTMEAMYEGLNALGRLPWTINNDVLDVVEELWEKHGGDVAGLPPLTDLQPPPRPTLDSYSTTTTTAAAAAGAGGGGGGGSGVEGEAGGKGSDGTAAATAAATAGTAGTGTATAASTSHDPTHELAVWRRMVKRVEQRNRDLHSLRCDTNLKLKVARQCRDETVYFPFNLDFRGRVYPIPPHLNHLGNDLCRGLLMFAEARPLGPRGLRWLKIQLANLCGYDKASFDDREQWVNDRLEHVYDSATNPIHGSRWWAAADDPLQALATCCDLQRALDSPDPSQYMSRLPVHQDGSCNGLQHYAALGRDVEGARMVNLLPAEKPQDVYMGVARRVIKRVDADAAEGLPAALLLQGRITRKVVKQTVMTSVYGVTYIGARKQVQNRLMDIFAEEGPMSDEMEQAVYDAASYCARITLDAIGEQFKGASDIMDWLAQCARDVAVQDRQVVRWITPLGLPVFQPYRRGREYSVRTVLQSVIIEDSCDLLPVSPQRQRSAFAPNFVHSLDSSHMLLTAIECDRRGLSFTAVHDSYWTHAGSMEEMNEALRDAFIELHKQPILEDLEQHFHHTHPGIAFPPLPARGELDLDVVKESAYFFS